MSELALIIEDDEDLANIFAEALRGVGFEVEHVVDGRMGQQRLKQDPPPYLILLDMHLPGVSGEQIHAMLTERGEAHRVIICSADVKLVERYRSAGVRALTKPAPMTELQRVVQEVVCQGELARGSAS